MALSPATTRALQDLAHREHRRPQDQAVWLLEQALRQGGFLAPLPAPTAQRGAGGRYAYAAMDDEDAERTGRRMAMKAECKICGKGHMTKDHPKGK